MSGTNPRGLEPVDESPPPGSSTSLGSSHPSGSSHPTGSSPRCLPDVRIESLLDLFYSEGQRHQRLGRFTPVKSVPAPYDRLLDHDEHMTVTVEAFHRQKVDVRVHRSIRSESSRSETSDSEAKDSARPSLVPQEPNHAAFNNRNPRRQRGISGISSLTPRVIEQGQFVPAARANWYAREITLVGSESGKVVQYGIVKLNVDTLSPNVWRQIESQSVPLGRVLIENGVLREVQLQGLWRVEAGPVLAALLDLAIDETVYGRTALIYCDGEPAIELLEIVVDR